MLQALFGMNIAVKDLEEAVPKYEALMGVKARSLPESVFAFPGIKGAVLELNGIYFSLLTSSEEANPVGHFLKKSGEGILLVSLRVDDIENDIEELRTKNMQFFLPGIIEGPFGKVNFILPKSMNGVQFEIFQPDEQKLVALVGT